MKPSGNQITIIGAGLGGIYLAILLAKRGFKVDIYERASEKQLINTSSKKSFNITFYSFAIDAFKKAGLWEDIQNYLVRLKGSVTQIGGYKKPVVSHFEKDIPFYTVSRTKLLSVLIRSAKKLKGINFHFETTLVSIDKKTNSLTLYNEPEGETSIIKADIIIGADGVNSKVRGFLQKQKGAKHSQIYEDWEYKQIKLDLQTVTKLRLKNNYTYSWTRKNSLITGYPSRDGSFDAMIILPNSNGLGFDNLENREKITEFISKNYPSLVSAITNITKDIITNPKGCFVTIHTHPWYFKGFIAILGDAAHGFPPFCGQGVSSAFGDSLEIVDLLDSHDNNWSKILPLYQDLRKKHMDALGEFSREIFTLYRRYKKADYSIIYDKFEQTLHNIFPQLISPTPSYLIAADPSKTAYIISNHQSQRKFFKRLGIPIIIKLITNIVDFQERYLKI